MVSIPCNVHTLPNGLRVIHQPSPSEVTYCGLAINAGSRDEPFSMHGMAHCVEHLLFKGTTHRKSWHILNRMEHVGGDLNAYTNKEETVVYAAFLNQHLARAVELISDIVFNSVFPPTEMQKEMGVIVDEIESYNDMPSELIFDRFEDLLFPHHPLGRNILGEADTLRGFTPQQAKNFTNAFYHPGNMVFFVWGRYDFKRILRLCDKYLAPFPYNEVSLNRTPPPNAKPCEEIVPMDTHQAHVMLGARACGAREKDYAALCLLNNILGGPGMNSRLNIILRERRGLVYNIESNLVTYTDTGVFSVYFGTDPVHVEKCLELVRKELKRMCQCQIPALRLEAWKKQLIGQIGVASDCFENNALDMGKSFLHYNKLFSPTDLCRRISALTPTDVLAAANNTFPQEALSLLVYK